MKYFVTFSLLFLFTIPAFAEEMYLRDVPEGHYAYDAVYDLIKMGVTGGYPDGTFRGKNLMNRFEIAAFLSKFAKSTNLDRGINEKLVEELKSEISLIRYEKDKEKKERVISGELQSRWRNGKTINLSGAKADYRLKARMIRSFGDAASFVINLDTMGEGFNGGQRDLVREMLDLEGKVKIGSVTLKATSGPGDITHKDDGLFPIENNMIFRRPQRAVAVSASVGRTDFSLEYLSRATQSSGLIDVSEISAKLSQDFYPFKFIFNPRFFNNSNGERDARLELTAGFNNFSILLGMAKGEGFPEGLYVRGDLAIGEGIKMVAQKIGTQYREKFSYGIFDLFDRNLPDGSSNIGLELNKKLGKHWFAGVKGDFTSPGEIITSEYRLGYSFDVNSAIELVYQTYRAGALSDNLTLALKLLY